MERLMFRHLGREWEAAVPELEADTLPVRFQEAAHGGMSTYEARVSGEELDPADPAERELALRRALESALVLDALAGVDQGLTVDEVAERTGIPADATADRLAVLDSVQPFPVSGGTTRYRRTDTAV